MRIFDISQEIFGCEVYPGDPVPQKEELCRMEAGDLYNLTAFRMCAHNGTHIDAPFHFFKEGKTVEKLPPESFIGRCFVAELQGDISAEMAAAVLAKAAKADREAAKRILVKGDAVVSAEAAQIFAAAGVLLLGGESQSVGPAEAPMAVHKILLGAEVILLEGVRLAEVPEGVYFLNAAPLNLAGADGAPCRAFLVAFEE